MTAAADLTCAARNVNTYGRKIPEREQTGSRGGGEDFWLGALASVEPGLRIRRLDAEALPPVSDYAPFWDRAVPFVFLTAGRAAYYHTPDDTPDKLDYPKMAALARWLQRWTRETCARPLARIPFQNQRDDAAGARTLVELARALEPFFPAAATIRATAQTLLDQCDPAGRLPSSARRELQGLLLLLESSLA